MALAFALVLGAVLIGLRLLLGQAIRNEALAGAERTARVFADLALQPDEYSGGRFSDEAAEDLDKGLAASGTLRGARVWSRDYRLLYADDGRLVGQEFVPPADLVAALNGEVRSRLSRQATEQPVRGRAPPPKRDVLEVYIPVRLEPGARPVNALELFFPYGPVREDIERRIRQLLLVLFGSGAILYVALLPTLRRGAEAFLAHRRRRNPRLRRELGRALDRDELELYYQPKLDLAGGEVTGVEALLRWRHSKRGTLPPDEFIPWLEQTDLIGPVTLRVADLAFAALAYWRSGGFDLDMSINLPPSLLRDDGLPRRLGELVGSHGLAPEMLTLEVTEGTLGAGSERQVELLGRLREMGFKLSLDDFGKGFSSLSRLAQLPLDELKIDRSFVAKLEYDQDPKTVTAIVSLARAQGLRVVAEGVEREETTERLAELGCDEAQGFGISRPLEEEAMTAWLHARRAHSVIPG